MTVQIIETDKAPAAIGPYSQGISAGPYRFISGQLGMDPKTGELVSDALAPQARQALKNLQQVVEAGGGGLQQVVAVDVFLTDMAAVSYTHLTLPTNVQQCRSRWSPYH